MPDSIFQQRWIGGKRSGMAVRVMLPKGIYADRTIAVPGGVLVASRELVFSVVEATCWDWREQDALTEMDWLTPQEIRLFGSIFLCQTFDSPALILYPSTQFVFLKDEAIDPSSGSGVAVIREALLNGEDHPRFTPETVTFRRGFDYYLADPKEFEVHRQPSLFAGIDPQDPLMLRGLSTLMKSSMLSTYGEFAEEAIIVLFVSLETSLRIILRRLSQEGVTQPTVKDAANWIYESFDKPLGRSRKDDGYFSEFYEKRVMTLHPESRYGIYAFAPLIHCDQHYLRDLLTALYAYLITGQHSDEYLGWLEQGDVVVQ